MIVTNLTLAELCLGSAKKYGRRTAFEMYRQEKIYGITSYRLLGIRTRQIALLLEKLGVHPGGRVLLVSENRPEWPAAWFGISLAGAISVILPEGFSPQAVRRACAEFRPAAVCASRRHVSVCLDALAQAGLAVTVPLIVIDDISGKTAADMPVIDKLTGRSPSESLRVSLNGIEKRLPLTEASGLFPGGTPDDTAAIFCSANADNAGDSGGTAFTHRELLSRSAGTRTKLFPRDRLLATIPLSALFEITHGLLRAVACGALTVYLEKHPAPEELFRASQALKPTVITAVPRLVEEIRAESIEPALKNDPLYRHNITRFLAFKKAGRKLLSALGKTVRCLEIDGALPPETEDFLQKIRFPYAPDGKTE